MISVDGSSAAAEATAALVPTAFVLLADLLHLPLSDQSVDAAFSIGVLHHTENPQVAFNEVARTVKVGGQLAVWLYINTGGDGNAYVTDPMVDLAAKFLHEITRACPRDVLYSACEKYGPSLRDLYAKTGAWGPFQKVMNVSMSKDNAECVSDTFDWHCPQYRSGHTFEEVSGGFKQAGFEVDRLGDFPVCVRGVKRFGG